MKNKIIFFIFGIFCSIFAFSDGEVIPPEWDEKMRQFQEDLEQLKQQIKGPAYLASVQPQIQNGSGFFIQPAIFYWNVRENGLSYAIENEGSTTIANRGDLKDPRFRWNLGFKFGMGYIFARDGWDVFLNFTHIHIKGFSNADAEDGKVLFPIWTNAATQTGPGFVSRVRGNWRLHFGMFDLELGKQFLVGPLLSLRPHIGLKAAEIRQKYKFLYMGGNLFPDSQDELSMKNKFWGIGPRAGLNSLWNIGAGLSIYGNAAISLLYGDFHVHEGEHAKIGIEDRMVIFHRFQLSRAVTDLMLGVCWEYLFHDDRFRIVLQAGWDQHLFFGQNQFLRFVNPEMQGAVVGNQGDLCLQGWTWGFSFDF